MKHRPLSWWLLLAFVIFVFAMQFASMIGHWIWD